METMEFEKGTEVYDVSGDVKDKLDETLNKEFEDTDATLKQNFKITLNIENN